MNRIQDGELQNGNENINGAKVISWSFHEIFFNPEKKDSDVWRVFSSETCEDFIVQSVFL